MKAYAHVHIHIYLFSYLCAVHSNPMCVCVYFMLRSFILFNIILFVFQRILSIYICVHFLSM